jgi:hypothetical protein
MKLKMTKSCRKLILFLCFQVVASQDVGKNPFEFRLFENFVLTKSLLVEEQHFVKALVKLKDNLENITKTKIVNLLKTKKYFLQTWDPFKQIATTAELQSSNGISSLKEMVIFFFFLIAEKTRQNKVKTKLIWT